MTMRPEPFGDGATRWFAARYRVVSDLLNRALPGFVWMRRPEVAGSGAARLRWSHA